MKKYLFLFIALIMLFPVNINAATKEDVINYVNEKQSVICDASTKQLFKTYQILFTRMLKEKELSSNDLDNILNKLRNAISIIESNSVCKQSDLGNLSSSQKEQIKNNLYGGLMIIYDAPPRSNNSSSSDSSNDSSNNNSNSNPNKPNTNSQSGIVIDKNNNTIDIYQDGNLYDKVGLNQKTFNYVGPNPIILISLIILATILIISTITYFILKNKKFKYKELIRDISFSLMIITLIALPSFYMLRGKIDVFLNLASMLKQPSKNTEQKEVLVNENNEIVSYPAYGDKYASLKIPNLNIELPIKFGDSKEILANSIGHTSTSFLPGEGGTILMSGHNSTSMLGNLKNIDKGNKITIETSYGIFTYEVEEIKIMKLEQYNEIKIENNEKLILYTCYPFSDVLYGNERYVVISKLIEEKWGDD